MRRLRIALVASCAALTMLVAFVSKAPIAAAEPEKCYEMVDLNVVEVTCEHSVQTIRDAQIADPSAEFKVYQLCKDGTSGEPEACSNPRVCTVGGVRGTLYAVFKNGSREGIACLTAGDTGQIENPPLRDFVNSQFDELGWQPSDLVVQPPGGKTLVNFETNFYTTNDRARSIPVRLLGQTVTVTARPIAYRWNFGDGTSITTDSPGRPYPNLDVSHTYDRADPVVVSIDTQYGDASFTVNGGPPETIPSTVWVTGSTQDLEVVEALPQLVVR